jgi:hypothetical protein
MTRRPYVFPLLLAGVQAGNVEYDCQRAICAAWREGKPTHEGASVKAARDRLSLSYLTPADLYAVVQALVAYDQSPWPNTDDERNAKVEWLRFARLPYDAPRRGTNHEARVAVRYTIEAAISILLEVPIEHEADEAALLQILILARWAVPRHQRKRLVQRMAGYMAGRMARESFAPVAAGART